MKRITAILAGIAGALALVFAAVLPASAQSYPNGQNVSVSVVVEQAATFTLNTTTATLAGIPGQAVSAPVQYNVLTNDASGYKVLAGWATPIDAVTQQVSLNGQNISQSTPGNTVQSTTSASAASGDNFTDTLAVTIPNTATGTHSATLQYTLVPN